MSTDQGEARPWSPTRWVDCRPSHDVVLTRTDVEEALPGVVLSVEARFGPDNDPVAISVERTRDGMWVIHTRAHVPSEALSEGGRRRVVGCLC